MKAEKVEELYEHFDVEFYEKARGMVGSLSLPKPTYLTLCSTHSGRDTEIREAYHSTSMSSSTSTVRMYRNTRKSRKHTRRVCRITRVQVHLLSCSLCLRCTRTCSNLYSRCARPSNGLIPKYLSRIQQILSISPMLA
jgi:hypothetical protein